MRDIRRFVVSPSGVAVVIALLCMGVIQIAQAQVGTLCDLGRDNWIICPPGTVCNPARQMCSEPVKPRPGYLLCPDGLTSCPNDMVCNMEAPPNVGERCIVPGSTRCDLHNGTTWCRPGLVCDKKRAMCAEPIKAQPGYQLCPDGLTSCPNDMLCNMEATDGQRCIEPGSVRCDFRGGPHWCKPGQVCDYKRVMCVDPVKPQTGYQLCSDGLTTCPNNMLCNMEATDGQRCIEPGSVRCDFHGGPHWCKPGQVCDYKRVMCVDPVKPRPGYQLCSDGLTTCPNNMLCNMEATDGQRCIEPGSVRCDFHGGPHWCKPGQVCDYKRVMCVDPVKPRPGYLLCPDGVTTCPNDMVCNLDPDGGSVEPCIYPGSTRCDLHNGPTWCRPGFICDKLRNMCVEQKIGMRLEGPRKAKAGDTVRYTARIDSSSSIGSGTQGTYGYYWYVNGQGQNNTGPALSFTIPKDYKYSEIKITARLVKAGAGVDYLAQADMTLEVVSLSASPAKPQPQLSNIRMSMRCDKEAAKPGEYVRCTAEIDANTRASLSSMKSGWGYYWYVNGQALKTTNETMTFGIREDTTRTQYKVVAQLARSTGKGSKPEYLKKAEKIINIQKKQAAGEADPCPPGQFQAKIGVGDCGGGGHLSNVTITIGGSSQSGQSPLTFPCMPWGKYKLRMEAPGYKPSENDNSDFSGTRVSMATCLWKQK
ncbi:MAG TPA: hypothetical protein VN328_00905 [Thermodesulfovibrionales bacterium]|nr:hypothetical protein [Thermodesulfovibrionales bacterium]